MSETKRAKNRVHLDLTDPNPSAVDELVALGASVVASHAEAVASTALPLNVLAQPDVQRLANLGVRRISTGSLLFRAAIGSAIATVESVRDGKPIPPIPSYQAMKDLA